MGTELLEKQEQRLLQETGIMTQIKQLLRLKDLLRQMIQNSVCLLFSINQLSQFTEQKQQHLFSLIFPKIFLLIIVLCQQENRENIRRSVILSDHAKNLLGDARR